MRPRGPRVPEPFIVFGLPRSGTYWLSRVLSYGDWTCWHEQAPRMRSLDDVKAWFSQDFTGTVETAAAPFWRTVFASCPGIRVLVVRRSPEAVLDSLMRLNMRGVCTFDRGKLAGTLAGLDRKLNQIEARVPNVLSVRFEDLWTEVTGERIFQHCLGLPLNRDWWLGAAQQNLQTSMPALMRYMLANRVALDRTVSIMRRQSLMALRPRKVVNRDDVTIQQESCEVWFRDGKHLFEEHALKLGEAPDEYLRRNWPLMLKMDAIGGMQIMTARCNGRMVGYYVCYIAPATDHALKKTSTQISIFVTRDFAGLGYRLKQASIEALEARGVGEINFRAGINGDGERMAAVYERSGAECIGKMYRLDIGGR